MSHIFLYFIFHMLYHFYFHAYVQHSLVYMGDCPERDLYDARVSFFNTIHFELLKIGRVVDGPVSDDRKNFLTDSHKLNLWRCLKSVITEALLLCL